MKQQEPSPSGMCVGYCADNVMTRCVWCIFTKISCMP